MADKRSICRYDDYIESKAPGSYHKASANPSLLTEFKLDRIYPKNISLKLSGEGFDGLAGSAIKGEVRSRSNQAFKLLNSSENKFYHEYMHAK
jgi:hypothetical protein